MISVDTKKSLHCVSLLRSLARKCKHFLASLAPPNFDLAPTKAVAIEAQPYESLQEKTMNVKLIVFSWQGLEDGNITFSDELDFDPAELNIVYKVPNEDIK